jgi:hypothetical protein
MSQLDSPVLPTAAAGQHDGNAGAADDPRPQQVNVECAAIARRFDFGLGRSTKGRMPCIQRAIEGGRKMPDIRRIAPIDPLNRPILVGRPARVSPCAFADVAAHRHPADLVRSRD